MLTKKPSQESDRVHLTHPASSIDTRDAGVGCRGASCTSDPEAGNESGGTTGKGCSKLSAYTQLMSVSDACGRAEPEVCRPQLHQRKQRKRKCFHSWVLVLGHLWTGDTTMPLCKENFGKAMLLKITFKINAAGALYRYSAEPGTPLDIIHPGSTPSCAMR